MAVFFVFTRAYLLKNEPTKAQTKSNILYLINISTFTKKC